MNTFGSKRVRDEIVLAARILLVLLFLVFGWSKLTDYSGTVGYLAQTGATMRSMSALVAIAVELSISIAIVVGVWTRPPAVLMALYTLAAAFIGHHYWTMTGADAYANEINFFKNLSIFGGFLLLYVTGAGRYSVDWLLSLPRGAKPLTVARVR